VGCAIVEQIANPQQLLLASTLPKGLNDLSESHLSHADHAAPPSIREQLTTPSIALGQPRKLAPVGYPYH